MAGKKILKAKQQDVYEPADSAVPRKYGGGILKEYVIREIPSGKVVHYALAYINPLICGVDNGRVLGYDNSHGYSHKHLMGKKMAVPFTTYEELVERFEKEWLEIAVKFVNGELK